MHTVDHIGQENKSSVIRKNLFIFTASIGCRVIGIKIKGFRLVRSPYIRRPLHKMTNIVDFCSSWIMVNIKICISSTQRAQIDNCIRQHALGSGEKQGKAY